MPRGSPNLGKTARVISVVLPHVHLLFVQRDSSLLNQQGASWSYTWPWFPTTGCFSSGPRTRQRPPSKHAQRKFDKEILAIRRDNGSEFKNYTLEEFLSDEGIEHQYSAPYTPQQNGVAERKNRTLVEMARSMLDEYKSPHSFWAEAVNTACHASNRLFLRKRLHMSS